MSDSVKNQRIKILRADLGLDQGPFAELLGFKQGSISDIERGKVNVSDRLIFKMSSFFANKLDKSIIFALQ